LIVPETESLKKYLSVEEIDNNMLLEITKRDDINDLFKTEIKARVNLKKGFNNHQLVKDFVLLSDDFEVGVELTNTMKKRRSIIIGKNEDKVNNFE